MGQATFPSDSLVVVPLFRRGKVVRSALVDCADAGVACSLNWRAHSDGYAVRWQNNRSVLMHRQILGLSFGDGRFGDHINQNRLDNRRANLRVVDAVGNSVNRTLPLPSSGVAGIRKHGNRFAAYFRRKHLGTYDSIHDAVAARRTSIASFFTSTTTAKGGA